MTTSLIRVPFTLAAGLAFHVAVSPPTAPTAPPKTAMPRDRHAQICAAARFTTAMLTKGFYWAAALTDTLVLLAPYVHTIPASFPIAFSPDGSAGQFLACIRAAPPLPPLPLVAIAGTALALSGAFLRSAACRALGQFYACPNVGPGPCVRHHRHGHRQGHAHALITTGPYAVVRHPGYAGLVLCTAGLVLLHGELVGALEVPVAFRLGSGSGFRVRGIRFGLGRASLVGTVSAWMRTIALSCALVSAVGAILRIRDEERALRERFKGEWEAWTERVRYRLVPGVY